MASGSFCSKYPPARNLKPIRCYWVRYDGVVFERGVQPVDTIVFRGYTSNKTVGFKSTKSRNLPLHAFKAYTAVISDPGGNSEEALKKPDGTVGYNRFYGSANEANSFPIMYNVVNGFWQGISSDAAINSAEAAALSKASNLKFNAAQALGESKQTGDLLVNSINRFAMFASAVRDGNFAKARKYLQGRDQLFSGRKWPKNTIKPPTQDQFANSWLELTYGWTPLVQDIYGAAELLAQQAMDVRPTKVSATGYDTVPIKRELYDGWFRAKAEGTARFRAKCAFEFTIDDNVRDTMKQTGITNPALLAWELLPYSFVVDWFLPVGQYLENLEATSGLKFVRGFTTVVGDYECKSSLISQKAPPNPVYSNVDSYSCRGEMHLIERIVHTDFPQVRLPSFEWGLGLSRAMSALSLINQVFARNRKTRIYR